jgi:hypothetical protein
MLRSVKKQFERAQLRAEKAFDKRESKAYAAYGKRVGGISVKMLDKRLSTARRLYAKSMDTARKTFMS